MNQANQAQAVEDGEKITSILRSLSFIKDRHGKLVKKREALKQQRDVLEHAPLSRADVLAHFETLLDRATQFSTKALQRHAIRGGSTKGLKWEVGNFGVAGRPPLHLLSVFNPDMHSPFRDINDVYEFHLLAILAPQIRKYLKQVVADAEWPEGTPELTRAERLEEIERLDTEIAEIDGEISRLEGQAQEAGVHL